MLSEDAVVPQTHQQMPPSPSSIQEDVPDRAVPVSDQGPSVADERKRAATPKVQVTVPVRKLLLRLAKTEEWHDASVPIPMKGYPGFEGVRVKRVLGVWYGYSPEGKAIQIPDVLRPAISGSEHKNLMPEDTLEFVVC